MRFRLRRERIVAGPGDVVVVPPGVPHDFLDERGPVRGVGPITVDPAAQAAGGGLARKRQLLGHEARFAAWR